MRYSVPTGQWYCLRLLRWLLLKWSRKKKSLSSLKILKLFSSDPDPTESEVVQQILEQTEQVYDASSSGTPGPLVKVAVPKAVGQMVMKVLFALSGLSTKALSGMMAWMPKRVMLT